MSQPTHDPKEARRRTVARMDEEEQRKPADVEDARAEDEDAAETDGDPPTSPQVGGPSLTGLTPPD